MNTHASPDLNPGGPGQGGQTGASSSIVVCPHCTAANRVPHSRLISGAVGAVCGKCKQALFAGTPVELSAANFAAHVERSEIPLVVDFWAPWCAPCRAMAPAFAQAAAELEPRVRLGKLNTEEESPLAGRFGIRSIPTLIVFKQGREIARQSGAMDVASLIRWIRSQC